MVILGDEGSVPTGTEPNIIGGIIYDHGIEHVVWIQVYPRRIRRVKKKYRIQIVWLGTSKTKRTPPDPNDLTIHHDPNVGNDWGKLTGKPLDTSFFLCVDRPHMTFSESFSPWGCIVLFVEPIGYLFEVITFQFVF